MAVTVAVAQWLLAGGQIHLTCLTLTVFDLEVHAQAGKRIPVEQASALVTDANRIKNVLACTK